MMPMRLLRCVMPSTAARNLNCPILKLDDISSWASPLEHHRSSGTQWLGALLHAAAP